MKYDLETSCSNGISALGWGIFFRNGYFCGLPREWHQSIYRAIIQNKVILLPKVRVSVSVSVSGSISVSVSVSVSVSGRVSLRVRVSCKHHFMVYQLFAADLSVGLYVP